MTFEIKNNKKGLRQVQNAAIDFLKLNDIDDAVPDVRLIMEKVTGFKGSELFMNSDMVLSDEQISEIEEMINKRAEHVPVQHLLKEAWFYGRSFYVDERVLIPRFDTEMLIEAVLGVVDTGMKVLDVCTGSGCIILTLDEESDITAEASDVSEDALEVAKINSERLGSSCVFHLSDMFENITGKYDVIVSNPPYIKTKVIDTLQEEVKDNDPLMALDGGEDGLDFYREIASKAGEHLKENGYLFLEIGFDQAEEVSKLLEENGYKEIHVIYDLGNNPRVVRAVFDP